ncbi:MAG: PadR family transcriptional regulator [Candidatus Aminicenantes bacterium]|nr:PadR family transcriptional regulator [Candidatus Aminicenantes bacterium]
MTKKFISRSEEYILLSVLLLGEEAYGVAVRNQLKTFTGESWAFGAVHVMLNRLEKKGLLTSRLTAPVSQRGGRSKRVFRLTPEGRRTLEKIKEVHDRVWSVLSEPSKVQ